MRLWGSVPEVMIPRRWDLERGLAVLCICVWGSYCVGIKGPTHLMVGGSGGGQGLNQHLNPPLYSPSWDMPHLVSMRYQADVWGRKVSCRPEWKVVFRNSWPTFRNCDNIEDTHAECSIQRATWNRLEPVVFNLRLNMKQNLKVKVAVMWSITVGGTQAHQE